MSIKANKKNTRRESISMKIWIYVSYYFRAKYIELEMCMYFSIGKWKTNERQNVRRKEESSLVWSVNQRDSKTTSYTIPWTRKSDIIYNLRSIWYQYTTRRYRILIHFKRKKKGIALLVDAVRGVCWPSEK